MKLDQADIDSYLSTYFYGESEGERLIRQAAAFAPGEAEREWMPEWAAEEERHHRMWADVCESKGVEPSELRPHMQRVFDITEAYVDAEDWLGSMVGSTVIEHHSTATARFLFPHVDSEVQRVLRQITGDDLAHLSFSREQLRERADSQEGRRAIRRRLHPYLAEVLTWPDDDSLLTGELPILDDTFNALSFHLGRIGVSVPHITFEDSLQFRGRRLLLRAGMQLRGGSDIPVESGS